MILIYLVTISLKVKKNEIDLHLWVVCSSSKSIFCSNLLKFINMFVVIIFLVNNNHNAYPCWNEWRQCRNESFDESICNKLNSPICKSILSIFYSILSVTQPNIQLTSTNITGDAREECASSSNKTDQKCWCHAGMFL